MSRRTMPKKHKKPVADHSAERKTRKCLMCGKPFPSEWAGERVCRKCKSSAAWRSA
ncbi:MAG: hypothetical protein MI824_26950 [Hyphomicrobiales bacterium]|nr:hypothetical protein [Hyphomicrobiales bacterium]